MKEKRGLSTWRRHIAITVSMNTICLFYVRGTEKSFKQPFFLAKKDFWV